MTSNVVIKRENHITDDTRGIETFDCLFDALKRFTQPGDPFLRGICHLRNRSIREVRRSQCHRQVGAQPQVAVQAGGLLDGGHRLL